MQCFMPYHDFAMSAACLDRSRLGGQRKECVQLLRALDPWMPVGTPELCVKYDQLRAAGGEPSRGWARHPAALMWSGRLPALLAYLAAIDAEWVGRGYKSTLRIPELGPVVMPSWLGRADLHASHRSNLLRKLPGHYAQFGWSEGPDLEYVWPGPCCRLERAA